MTRKTDADVRRLTYAFAADLVALLKRSVADCVESALDGHAASVTRAGPRRFDARRVLELTPAAPPSRSGAKPSSNSRPLSYQAYECEVLLRAISEAGGDKLRAMKLLGLTKSAFYRQITKAGIDSRAPGAPIGFADDLPLSQEAYERDLLVRSIAANDGDMLRAARCLGVGKSTLYRRATYLGVDPRTVG